MPFLTIVAGPNGAGKSTHSADLTKHRGVEAFDFDKEFYSIWRQFQFDPNVEAGAIARTQELYTERKSEALASGSNFAFETNFHTDEVLSVAETFKEREYTVELIFIFLETPETAIERVNERVAKGGHLVSEETIRERFRSGLTRLDNTFNRFDSLFLYHSKQLAIERLATFDVTNKEVFSFGRIPNTLQLELPKLQGYVLENSKKLPPHFGKGYKQ